MMASAEYGHTEHIYFHTVREQTRLGHLQRVEMFCLYLKQDYICVLYIIKDLLYRSVIYQFGFFLSIGKSK